MKQQLTVLIAVAGIALVPAHAGEKLPRAIPKVGARATPPSSASYVAAALVLETERHAKQGDPERSKDTRHAGERAALLEKELALLDALKNKISAIRQSGVSAEADRKLGVQDRGLSTKRQEVDQELSALWLGHTAEGQARVRQALLKHAAELRRQADAIRGQRDQKAGRELGCSSPEE